MTINRETDKETTNEFFSKISNHSNEKYLKLENRYLSDIRHYEVLNLVAENHVDDIDWEDFDLFKSVLPVNKEVHFHNLRVRPQNWDDAKYGPFFHRRLLMVGIPSAHSRTVHKVILSYKKSQLRLYYCTRLQNLLNSLQIFYHNRS